MRILAVAVLALGLQLRAGSLDELLNNLNVRAQADRNGFAMQVASQFHVGDAAVRLVLGDVRQPADAFMVFQMAELTGRPHREVLDVYRNRRGKGWGELAKELGIKPGSAAFHRLKNGDFRLSGEAGAPDDRPGRGRGKGHGKGHGRD